MNKTLLYGLLAATGLVGVYLFLKKDKGNNGGLRSAGEGLNLGIKGENNSSVTVTDTANSEVIDINDGANSSTVVNDFSNSGLSGNMTTTETTSEGTTTTTITGSTTTITTVTDTGVTTEEIETEGFTDEPYTQAEVESLYAAGGNEGNGLWVFADNYYSGDYSSGNLGFLGKLMGNQYNSNTTYKKPPYYVGQTVYVRQFDNQNPKFMDYNGAVQIDGIYQDSQNGQWMVDTTRNRLGSTPVNGGIISKDAGLLSVSYVGMG